MKVTMYEDERWPDYILRSPNDFGWNKQIEISEEFWEEYLIISAKYKVLQSKLGLLYKEEQEPQSPWDASLIYHKGDVVKKEGIYYSLTEVVDKVTGIESLIFMPIKEIR